MEEEEDRLADLVDDADPEPEALVGTSADAAAYRRNSWMFG